MELGNARIDRVTVYDHEKCACPLTPSNGLARHDDFPFSLAGTGVANGAHGFEPQIQLLFVHELGIDTVAAILLRHR